MNFISARMPHLQRILFKALLNLWPCIRGTGARITYLAPDYHELRLELPLNWRTRNRVGTIFGGSIYASVDPFYMILLMEILGPRYVVWDKGAEIRFRKPGKDTLHATFRLTPEFTSSIRERVDREGELSFDLEVELKDRSGVAHASVRKTLYVATKAFYRAKLEKKTT